MNIGDIGRVQDEHDLENAKKKIDGLNKAASDYHTKVKDMEKQILLYKSEIERLESELLGLYSENTRQKGEILIYTYKNKYMRVFMHQLIEAGRKLSHPTITPEQKDFESIISELENLSRDE